MLESKNRVVRGCCPLLKSSLPFTGGGVITTGPLIVILSHSFGLAPTAHSLRIDFGSVAPLHPEGSQLIPKRYRLVPSGIYANVSPDVLRAHEETLVVQQLEINDDGLPVPPPGDGCGYGVEAD